MGKGHHGIPVLPGHCPHPGGLCQSSGCCLGAHSPGLSAVPRAIPVWRQGLQGPPCMGVASSQGESCVLSYSKNENDSKIWAFPGALGIYQGLACGQAALGCPHGCPWGTGPLATPGLVTPCAVFAGSAARTQRGKVAGAW